MFNQNTEYIVYSLCLSVLPSLKLTLIKEDSQADDVQQYFKGVSLIQKLISWRNPDSKKLYDFARFFPLVCSG